MVENLCEHLREVPGTKYYDPGVHQAVFVLPEFPRAQLEERRDFLPTLGRALGSSKQVKVLRAGPEAPR